MRGAVGPATVAALLLVGCGGARQASVPPATRPPAGPLPAAEPRPEGATPATRDAARGLEPPWPTSPADTVRFGRVRLEHGDTLRLAIGRCQDALVLIEEGSAVFLRGDGAAAPDAERRGSAPEAFRLAAGTATAIALAGAEGGARLFVLVARAAPRARALPDWDHPLDDATCGEPDDAVVRVDVATLTPLVAANGKALVRIVFDATSARSRFAALSLFAGAPDLTVPEHTHAGASETLVIDVGEGRMRRGDEEIAVRPGSVVHVPAGVLHDFRSAGASQLHALQIYAPPGPEQRFRGAPEAP